MDRCPCGSSKVVELSASDKFCHDCRKLLPLDPEVIKAAKDRLVARVLNEKNDPSVVFGSKNTKKD